VPTRPVGPPEGTFVLSKDYADKVIEEADGSIRKLEELLGLEPGYLGDAPVRVDISDFKGLRMPSGNEPGANELWLPSGYTKGGVPEAVIDQVPLDEIIVTEIFN